MFCRTVVYSSSGSSSLRKMAGPEDECMMILQNIRNYPLNTASHAWNYSTNPGKRKLKPVHPVEGQGVLTRWKGKGVNRVTKAWTHSHLLYYFQIKLFVTPHGILQSHYFKLPQMLELSIGSLTLQHQACLHTAHLRCANFSMGHLESLCEF